LILPMDGHDLNPYDGIWGGALSQPATSSSQGKSRHGGQSRSRRSRHGRQHSAGSIPTGTSGTMQRVLNSQTLSDRLLLRSSRSDEADMTGGILPLDQSSRPAGRETYRASSTQTSSQHNQLVEPHRSVNPSVSPWNSIRKILRKCMCQISSWLFVARSSP
jgi:hypothetical protein